VASFGSLLLMVGLLAALFFCIRWLVDFYFASYILITEEKTGRKALSDSKKLVDNRRWAAIFRILLPKLVFIIVLITAQSILSYVVVYLIAAIAGFNSDMVAKANSVANALIVSFVSILGTPILVLADYFVFDSLRKTIKK
jgi:ribonuclease HII